MQMRSGGRIMIRPYGPDVQRRGGHGTRARRSLGACEAPLLLVALKRENSRRPRCGAPLRVGPADFGPVRAFPDEEEGDAWQSRQ